MILTRDELVNIIKDNATAEINEGASLAIPSDKFNMLIQDIYDLHIKNFEKHRQKHTETINEKCKLESQCKDFKKRLAVAEIDRLADLKAFQLFIDVMKGGTTHREKERFAYQATKTIEDKVKKIISALFIENLISSDDELPF